MGRVQRFLGREGGVLSVVLERIASGGRGQMDRSAPSMTAGVSPGVPGGSPEVFLLVGGETGHSPTPAIWNTIFRAAGRRWWFEARDVPVDDLAGIWAGIRGGTLAGAFVTMPHKLLAARVADEHDDHVRRCGAANLVIRRDAVLTAFNTDAAALERIAEGRRFAHAVVLGAGGAAKAAMSGLYRRCDRLSIVSVDEAEAAELSRLAEEGFEAVDVAYWGQREALARRADLIVNATPLGMVGLDAEPPVSADVLNSDTWIYDFVYRPDGSMTPLQSAGVWAEAQVSDGLAHLEEQAVLALPMLGLDPGLAELIREQVEVAMSRPPLRWGGR